MKRFLSLVGCSPELQNVIQNDVIPYVVKTACSQNNIDLLEGFLKQVNFSNVDFNEGFQIACQNGFLDIINAILNQPAIQIDLNNALEQACAAGQEEVAKLLLTKGATRVNNALISACISGDEKIVSVLVAGGNGVDVNNGLLGAVKGNNPHMVDTMLANGASNLFGALYEACKGGNREAVEKLLELGADAWMNENVYKHMNEVN